MNSKISDTFPNEDSYDLLDELLRDDYDKLEQFKDEYT